MYWNALLDCLLRTGSAERRTMRGLRNWLFVNFTVIFSSSPTQIQLPAMKQNPCSVVGEVAKPTGVGLDELDGAVESLCTGIADFVLLKLSKPVS